MNDRYSAQTGTHWSVWLVLGIATSMFTAIMGTRTLVQLIYGGKRKVERLSI